jgi:RNA polymerase sigma factor (sigma-70 family)
MAEALPVLEADARFQQILDAYGSFLRRLITQLCPTDLGIQFDDIEQEALLRLWRALQSEREIVNLPSYLYRIAASTTIDAIRRVKSRREEQLSLEEEEGEGEVKTPAATCIETPDRLITRQLVRQKVRMVLARLPENRRRAVGLYLQGMTSQEIAGLLRWTEAKARNLIYRGLDTLRRLLREEGIEYEME